MVLLDSLLSKTFNEDPDAFISYSFQYMKLAKETGDYDEMARKAMNLQHPLTVFAAEPQKAITSIDEVLKYSEKIKDSFLLGGLYLKRGRANAKINLKNAIEDYTEALEKLSRSDTLLRADTHLFRGQAHSNRGYFASAHEDYTKAYQLYESKHAYQYMIYSQQGIVNMFSMNGFYDKAKTEREILINKMIELDQKTFLANEYYNQAIDHKKTGDRAAEYQALLLAEKAIQDKPANHYALIGIHSMFISYYCDHDQLDEAKKHLSLLEALEYDFKRDLPSELNYLSGRIDYLLAIGEIKTALNLAREKLKIAEQLGFEDEILTSHKQLSEIYFKTNQLEESIIHARTASRIKDSLYNRGNANAMAYYQALYETEKKERELIEKTTSISLLRKDNENFKRAMFLAGVAIFLTFLLIQLYRSQLTLKERKKLQEVYTQKLLLSQEDERKRISENLHDGLGQQLLVIKNRLMATDDSQTRNLVDSAIEEVRFISRDLHPFLLKEFGITKAIEYTLSQIDENTNLFLSKEIDDINDLFSKDDELHIYRIIQESMSNVLKHSQATAAKVTIKKYSDYISITIRDNGIGFNFPEKYKEEKSLGLKTLLDRTKFLNGEAKISSKKDKGTKLNFEIPIQCKK